MWLIITNRAEWLPPFKDWTGGKGYYWGDGLVSVKG